ncbi:MAG: outer membrane beta-barrel protein [Bacteroidota bacterium]|nr:outer membrane beta-barrel protein [Bacteroidota bacterium]
MRCAFLSIFLSAAVVLASISTVAFAQLDKPVTYAIGVGISTLRQPDELHKYWNPGFMFGAALERNFTRTSLVTFYSYSYSTFDDRAWLNSDTATASYQTLYNTSNVSYFYVGENVRYSFPSRTGLSLFVDAGVGYFHISGGETVAEDPAHTMQVRHPGIDKGAFQFNLGVGLRIAAGKETALLITMREFFAATKPERTRSTPLEIAVEF